MKILIMSLQRIGDIVMTTPTIDGLRKKYPKAKIHLLINEQFKHIIPLIENVDNAYFFPYKLIQTSLGEKDRSFFESYDLVDDLVRSLSAEGYDQIINLTHTRLSGWLAALISSPMKSGLVLNHQGIASFGSKWFEYLNRFGSRNKDEAFHFIDIFFYGAGLRGQRRIRLKETEKGINEANKLTLGITPYIVIQPLTSDVKKNWGFDNWKKAMQHINSVDKSRSFLLLGAPSEEIQLKKLSELLRLDKITHKVVICDFEAAFSILSDADLLITGDTSIKHIASATNTPILEISIGSSSYLRTGSYSSKALILQAKESCAPCNHSESCSFEQKCSMRISPDGVALAAQAMLEKNESNLRMLANEYSDDIDFIRVQFSKDGDWVSYSLSEGFSKSSIIKWIDRSSQRFLYNTDNNVEVQEYGSEGMNLSDTLSKIFPDRDKYNWLEMYKEIEMDCESFQGELETVLTELRVAIKNYGSDESLEPLMKRLNKLLENKKYSEEFSTHLRVLNDLINETFKNNSEFYVMKKAREVITESLKRVQVEIKIVRSLKNQTLEGV